MTMRNEDDVRDAFSSTCGYLGTRTLLARNVSIVTGTFIFPDEKLDTETWIFVHKHGVGLLPAKVFQNQMVAL